jgi:hypothetical protein
MFYSKKVALVSFRKQYKKHLHVSEFFAIADTEKNEKLILCIGGAYYEPYNCLLISNKFCNGGSGPSMANKFLYAPAHPPSSVWALKPPSRALVHKTTYAPMIYTALCIMFWMRAYPFRGQVGGGWALKFSSFLGTKWHSYPLDAISQGPKILEFQGPTPSHLPL